MQLPNAIAYAVDNLCRDGMTQSNHLPQWVEQAAGQRVDLQRTVNLMRRDHGQLESCHFMLTGIMMKSDWMNLWLGVILLMPCRADFQQPTTKLDRATLPTAQTKRELAIAALKESGIVERYNRHLGTRSKFQWSQDWGAQKN